MLIYFPPIGFNLPGQFSSLLLCTLILSYYFHRVEVINGSTNGVYVRRTRQPDYNLLISIFNNHNGNFYQMYYTFDFAVEESPFGPSSLTTYNHLFQSGTGLGTQFYQLLITKSPKASLPTATLLRFATPKSKPEPIARGTLKPKVEEKPK